MNVSIIMEKLAPRPLKGPVILDGFKSKTKELAAQLKFDEKRTNEKKAAHVFPYALIIAVAIALAGTGLHFHETLRKETLARQNLQAAYFQLFEKIQDVESASRLNQNISFSNRTELHRLSNRINHVWKEGSLNRDIIQDTQKEVAMNDSQLALLGNQVHQLNRTVFPERYKE